MITNALNAGEPPRDAEIVVHYADPVTTEQHDRARAAPTSMPGRSSAATSPACERLPSTRRWYRIGTIACMAMNLRLTDAESEALRAKAEQEGRSMQDVARTAIAQYVSERPQRLLNAIQRVRSQDDELLRRLSR